MAVPFALSLCGRFVVERHEGEIYPNVMTITEARERQARAVREATRYAADGEPGMADQSQQIANGLFSALVKLSAEAA